MTMNLASARGSSRISNNPTYRPYQDMPSPTAMAKKDKNIREASTAKVKCRRGYVEYNGRCLPQEERNKKSNINQTSANNTINKSNERFYKV